MKKKTHLHFHLEPAMSYFDCSLLHGEQIVYRTRLHAMHWLRPLVAFCGGVALALRALHTVPEGLWAYALLAGALTAAISPFFSRGEQTGVRAL